QPSAYPADAQRVRVQDGQQDATDGDDGADEETVEQLASEVDPVPEVDDAVQVERVRQGQRSVARVVARAFEGVHHDDRHRGADEQQDGDEHEEHAMPAGSTLDTGAVSLDRDAGHAAPPFRSPRDCTHRKTTATTRMIRVSTVEMADP